MTGFPWPSKSTRSRHGFLLPVSHFGFFRSSLLLVVWCDAVASYWKHPSFVTTFAMFTHTRFLHHHNPSASTFLIFFPASFFLVKRSASVWPIPFQPLTSIQYLQVLLVSLFFPSVFSTTGSSLVPSSLPLFVWQVHII